MRFPLSIALVATFSLLPAAKLCCQTETNVTRAPDGDVQQGVDGLSVPGIAGAPFSLHAALETSHQLPDGTTVTHKSTMFIARDSQGRIYRERRRIVPADNPGEAQLIGKIVIDAVAKTRTDCILMQRICRITALQTPPPAPVEPVGPSKTGAFYLTRENLGASTVDDVEVQGTREIRTWNPGAFGNDHPVAVTKESWYSPRLQINLTVTRYDPRTGTQKITVSDLSLSDPDPSQFALPPGFRVIDERKPTTPMIPQPQP